MPLSAGSPSQAPSGRDLSPPNPLSHTPVRHPSSHYIPFYPDLVCRIRENTQRGRGVHGEEQSSWGGSDEKGLGEGLLTFSTLLLFRPNLSTSSVLHPAPPEPFAYSPRSGGGCPLSTFRSPPSPIHPVRLMPYCPLRPLTVRPTHSPAF